MDPAQTAAIPDVEGCLHEVLLQGRSCLVIVFVEFEERLGHAGVIETFFVENEIEDLLSPAPGDKVPQILADRGQGGAQVPIEGIAGQLLHERLEILPAFESTPVEDAVPLLEHACRSSRGRDKLQAAPGPGRLMMERNEVLLFPLRDPDDPIADGRRSVEGHDSGSPAAQIDLTQDLLPGDATRPDVIDVERAQVLFIHQQHLSCLPRTYS